MNDVPFLIDTNILITPYRQFYPFDFAKSFWNQMKMNIENGNISILDYVKGEILQGDENDKLRLWMEEIIIQNYIDHREKEIIQQYSEIMRYIQSCGFYSDAALSMWAKETVADPWLISAAKVKNYTLVTQETNTSVLSVKNPTKKIRIPDVSNHFGVKVVSLFDMMRFLNFSL